MKILAINTAGEQVQFALGLESKILTSTCHKKELASVVLLEELDRFLNENAITLNDIDYFAAVSGPGSFTGIRIGVATIRAFCQTLGKKAVSVNRLELLAYNIRNLSAPLSPLNNITNTEPHDYIVAIVDGQNGVSYVAVYNNLDLSEFIKPHAIMNKDLKGFLDAIKGNKVLCSDSLISIVDYNVEICKDLGEGTLNFVKHLISEGRVIDYPSLEPLYLRKSQAEREAGDI